MKKLPVKVTNKNASVFTLVDDDIFELLKDKSMHISNNKVTININSEKQSLHRLVLNAARDKDVDHINGDRLDNRRENLRECTPAENNCNRKRQINNTTGYKGVSFNKVSGRYSAQISKGGKYYYLGSSGSPYGCALAYRIAARFFHGEFARFE